MIFEGFKLGATPYIHDARCKCGIKLHQVDNGFFSMAMFCPSCENVYLLKLIKMPDKKVTKEFLKQAREQVKKESK